MKDKVINEQEIKWLQEQLKRYNLDTLFQIKQKRTMLYLSFRSLNLFVINPSWENEISIKQNQLRKSINHCTRVKLIYQDDIRFLSKITSIQSILLNFEKQDRKKENKAKFYKPKKKPFKCETLKCGISANIEYVLHKGKHYALCGKCRLVFDKNKHKF